jgi:hypothetical protein
LELFYASLISTTSELHFATKARTIGFSNETERNLFFANFLFGSASHNGKSLLGFLTVPNKGTLSVESFLRTHAHRPRGKRQIAYNTNFQFSKFLLNFDIFIVIGHIQMKVLFGNGYIWLVLLFSNDGH